MTATDDPASDTETALSGSTSTSPSSPRALLFDLDGTLVDTVALRVECWIIAFAEVGVSTDAAELGGLMGADGKRVAREVTERHGHHISDHRAELVDRRSGELFGERNTDPRPLPHVRELLEDLTRARVPWAIATSSRPDQTTASVRALDLPRPPRVVDASHVTHAKPAPDLLLAGAEQLGVAARDCWYLGDSTWDMIAARSAVMTGVGVPTGAADARTLRSSGAVLVIDHAGDLRSMLRDRGLLPG
jgi:HAD superfamily hydrolase (TIGR01509 family)